ncbi:unnamed protein product [Arabidopsis arenosa]|uniref:Uncharacterized protein n=1 Tax=Arabidopsis arenosa TaxID=38785 RepID=A0A8S2AWM4_ARAAE|nr:unnamed protein product [Arabidopsis arenosa]
MATTLALSRFCCKSLIEPLDLGKSNPESGDGGNISQVEEVTINDGDEKQKVVTQSEKPTIKDADEKQKADAQSKEPTIKDGDEKQKGQDRGGSVNNSLSEFSKNLMGVKVKIEKK